MRIIDMTQQLNNHPVVRSAIAEVTWTTRSLRRLLRIDPAISSTIGVCDFVGPGPALAGVALSGRTCAYSIRAIVWLRRNGGDATTLVTHELAHAVCTHYALPEGYARLHGWRWLVLEAHMLRSYFGAVDLAALADAERVNYRGFDWPREVRAAHVGLAALPLNATAAEAVARLRELDPEPPRYGSFATLMRAWRRVEPARDVTSYEQDLLDILGSTTDATAEQYGITVTAADADALVRAAIDATRGAEHALLASTWDEIMSDLAGLAAAPELVRMRIAARVLLAIADSGPAGAAAVRIHAETIAAANLSLPFVDAEPLCA